MQKHVKMLTKIFYELSIIGDSLEEENQVARLLASLPESYDMLVLALEASTEVPKLEIVTEKLNCCTKKPRSRQTRNPLP